MVAKPKLADPGALIRSGKLPTETVRICVDPDLVLDYERILERQESARSEAVRDLTDAPSMATPNGGAGAVPGAEFDADLAALRTEMDGRTVELTFQALPRPVFRRLVDGHPPRKDDEGKLTHPGLDSLGFNYETFMRALVSVSLVEPKLDEADLNLLIDERLTDGQWESLASLVYNLNRARVDVPFSQAASQKTRRSARR